MRRVRYQFGSLGVVKGKRRVVWTFRYYEIGADGNRRYRRMNIGTTTEYTTEAAAFKAVEGLRLGVNSGKLQPRAVQLAAVIERYMREELPERFSTRRSYVSLLDRWIKPQWGGCGLNQVRTLAVEHWLASLPLARKSKANIRNLLHLIYECARRWELIDRNPIELVRQSPRRRQTPRRLSVEEFRRLLAELREPFRTMAVLAGCLGLRISEILGLQWSDFNLLEAKVTIRRSVVQGHVGPAKTIYSEAALPLSEEIVAEITAWFSRATYRSDSDFVFASACGKPMWADMARDALRPAGEKTGLGKIGWHTLRHTYATVLEQLGARMKVAQELMRHADIQTTMNVYTGAMERDKREAVTRVAQAVLGKVQ